MEFSWKSAQTCNLREPGRTSRKLNRFPVTPPNQEEVWGKHRDRFRTTNATKWVAQAVVVWKNDSVHHNSNVVDFSDEISRRHVPKSIQIV